MAATVSRWPAALARRIGLSGALDMTTTRVGQTLHIPCVRGQHVVDFSITGSMPPNFVAKKMMEKGWTIGSKLTCPDCSRKKTKAPTRAESKEPEMKTQPEAVVETAPAQASPAAGKAKRLVYMALEDHYDENAKRYKPGHSDATIAKTCGGISEAAVKQIHEESYGPLGEPVDVTEFRNALVEARNEIAASGVASAQAITALERRLDAMVKKNGWAS